MDVNDALDFLDDLSTQVLATDSELEQRFRARLESVRRLLDKKTV